MVVYTSPIRGSPHAGVKFYDVQRGGGDKLEAGKTAVIHYTCRYRGLTAVSSREARTLGGNRTVAEPLGGAVHVERS